ncbi:carbohydrate-binding protein [bacterium]|nr:carbohydrate-binding protein [bacterium]
MLPRFHKKKKAALEAESFNIQSGVATATCTDAGGGQNVTNISHNDSLRFDNLAPGTGSTTRFRAARAAGTLDPRIEVRQGSIGSIAVPVTGGTQAWETIETPLAPSNGLSNLFLKFVENGSFLGSPLFNLNWISLILPPVPTALTSEPVSTTQISLSWTAAAGATGYQLQRSTTPGGPYTEIGGTLTTTYSDTGLSAGTRYFYVVRALYSGDVASSPSTQVSSVPSAPLTATDSALAAPAIGSDGNGGMKFALTFPQSGIGKFYQALTSADLASPSWSNASAVLMGTGGVLLIEIPMAPNDPKRFYKVNVWRE